MRRETRARSIIKTVLWRVIATTNSYAILLSFANTNSSNAAKAVYMNITGFFVYYIFERVCNYINWGIQNNSSDI
jgi:hypothetical protein